MTKQETELFAFTGIVDDTGLDYFTPATKENMYNALRRAKSNEYRHAKAFHVYLTEDTEVAIMGCFDEGQFIMAKLIVESTDDIKYVK